MKYFRVIMGFLAALIVFLIVRYRFLSRTLSCDHTLFARAYTCASIIPPSLTPLIPFVHHNHLGSTGIFPPRMSQVVGDQSNINAYITETSE